MKNDKPTMNNAVLQKEPSMMCTTGSKMGPPSNKCAQVTRGNAISEGAQKRFWGRKTAPKRSQMSRIDGLTDRFWEDLKPTNLQNNAPRLGRKHFFKKMKKMQKKGHAERRKNKEKRRPQKSCK